MPIYGYQCSACGHQKDVLQKMSDPNQTTCPECHEEAFARQVSAPAFQLKGSGWYVTDFRDGNQAKSGESKSEDTTNAEKSSGENGNSSNDSKSSSDSSSSSESASTTTNKTETGGSKASASPAPAPASKDPS